MIHEGVKIELYLWHCVMPWNRPTGTVSWPFINDSLSKNQAGQLCWKANKHQVAFTKSSMERQPATPSHIQHRRLCEHTAVCCTVGRRTHSLERLRNLTMPPGLRGSGIYKAPSQGYKSSKGFLGERRLSHGATSKLCIEVQGFHFSDSQTCWGELFGDTAASESPCSYKSPP